MSSANRVNVLDTETTGFSPKKGDRIVEIGIVEMINGEVTGREFHEYLSPGNQPVGYSANVHGLTDDFLADKPDFSEVYESFLDFIGTDPLVIHNVPFDMKFLNAEIGMVGGRQLKNKTIDTVELARMVNHGGYDNRLDTLIMVFGLRSTEREIHSALEDAQLLAQVYLNLLQLKPPCDQNEYPH